MIQNLKKTATSSKYIAAILHNLPSMIILTFGMIALYSSLQLIDGHRELLEFYNKSTKNGDVLYPKHLEKREAWLYWSVIAVAFSAFVLIVINNERVRQLRVMNDEKKENLKLLENRLVAMETTNDGIGIVDADGNLTYMNKALMALHEISAAQAGDFLGKPWYRLYNEKGQEEIISNVLPILDRQGFWSGESPIMRKSGVVAIAELSLTRLRDGGFIGTARDVTEKKKTEKEKEQLQSQFYQAQKMEAVGRLAGGIAHDFNNILAAMNGYAEFLIDDLDEKTPQHKFASNILQAGIQARDLVDQILAFSRRKESNVESLDLSISVHESVAMLSASLPKAISVQTNIETDSAIIKGSSTQISQVIMNLCVNAKDAMENGHGVLNIALRYADPEAYEDLGIVRKELPALNTVPPIRIEDTTPERTRLFAGWLAQGQKYAVLSVKDSGSGMSRIIMEHIFEPFFTTKPVDKGTGLGLSTVHGVVAGHQGAMIVDSIIGKGTSFEIFFPLAEGSVIAVRQEAADKPPAQAGGYVLLVEDQPDVSDMLATMLRRMGFDVDCCSGGLEALEKIRDGLEDYDVVITDHNMPKMTGLELVCQVHEDFPDLPFILLSGYSQHRLQEMMQEHPAIKAILRKPVSRKVLAQKINAVIAAARSGRKSAA